MKPQGAFRPRSPGIGAALLAGLLFGASTPCAKVLTGSMSSVLLAGLLYLGSGIGLALWLVMRQQRSGHATLSRQSAPWLAAAVLFGGVVGPILLMVGLSSTPGSTASLLLNLEMVGTALLAWFVFGESVDRRIAAGFILIVAGGLLLSWEPGAGVSPSVGWFAIVGACLCWALDNNFTQKISGGDPILITAVKGLVAGSLNVGLALFLGAEIPPLFIIGITLIVGLIGYGLSLALFVVALRNLGTARTSAYFSIAPFIGAMVSLLILDESFGPMLAPAGLLMAAGVWLHLTERHSHGHEHLALTHNHPHSHDEYHKHSHSDGVEDDVPHSHEHDHLPRVHSHPHFPDIHHRHGHKES